MRLGRVVGAVLLIIVAAGAWVLLGRGGRGTRDVEERGQERAETAPEQAETAPKQAAPEQTAPEVPERAPQAAPSEQEELARRQEPRWVVVTVLESVGGRPIPGARVHVSTQMPTRENPDGTHSSEIEIPLARPEEMTTDSHGRTRVGPIGPIGPGRVTVSVRARGFAAGETKIAGSRATAVELEATVRLHKSRRIAGLVLDPDGRPAPEALVRIRPARRELSMEASAFVERLFESSTKSGADGSFRFEDLPPGEFALAVRLTRGGELAADASIASGSTDVVLRLAEGAGPRRVLVRVVDAEGKPVPAAKAEYSYEYANPWSSGSMRRDVEDGRAEFDGDPEDGREQASGSIVVEHARGKDGGLLPLGRVRLTDVRWGTSVEVRLPAERTITGRVVGPDGRGVPAARVRAELVGAQAMDYPDRDTSSSFWDGADSVTTDAEGAFLLRHLGDGEHRVFALPPPAFAFPEPLVVAQGTPRVDVHLRSGIDVTVQIRDPDGAPVAGARVIREKASADPRDSTVRALFSWTLEGRVKVTDPGGAVPLRSLDPSARYVIGIRGPASRSDLGEHVDVSWIPADVTIRLPRALSVAGVVRDASGAPAAKTWVACQRISGLVTHATTGEDGTFRFTGLGPGPVWLYAGSKEGMWAEAGALGVTLISEPGDR